ncbi:putative transcription factor, K-box [Helianthus debilis subsp. tardiflorus]
MLFAHHRNFMGEDLDSLSIKEVLNLEQQLEVALRRLRLKKVHMCHLRWCLGIEIACVFLNEQPPKKSLVSSLKR